MRKLVVITGASRGLGAGMARQLISGDIDLLTLSRKPDPSLQAASGGSVEQWSVDLADAAAATGRLEQWLKRHDAARYASAWLINNAGILGQVGPIDSVDPQTLAAVIRIDLEAPLLLTAAFLRATRQWGADKRVLNISSGAAQRPIAHWAPYCAAKAGLDHLSRVVALDEASQPNPARIVSLAPGVIDTDMQAELRSEQSQFPEKETFVQLKASGELASAEQAAARAIAYLQRVDFGAQPLADARTSAAR